VLSLLAIRVVDAVLGLLVPVASVGSGLVFDANLTAAGETTEFSATIHINSLGFRDREFSIARSNVQRIVALGDSMTWGWGVDQEAAWPKALERALVAGGTAVEVANLGKPGASPADYADIAERSLPILKPDLTVIGVFQLDDLQQMEFAREKNLRMQFWKWKHYTLPNLFGIAERVVRSAFAKRATASWLKEWTPEAQMLESRWTGDDARRFAALDPEIKVLFRRGALNPAIIQTVVQDPTYFSDLQDATSDRVRRLVDTMSSQLARIESVARRTGGRVVVVSVPQGVYTDPRALASRRRIGFTVDDSMLKSDAPDVAIQAACKGAGIPFISVTEAFRRSIGPDPLFFDLDGHFTQLGHERFARLVAAEVSPLLQHR
jgi:lysophospholipase L1-like esterase